MNLSRLFILIFACKSKCCSCCSKSKTVVLHYAGLFLHASAVGLYLFLPSSPAAQGGCLGAAVWSGPGAYWKVGPGTACHPEACWLDTERPPQTLGLPWRSSPWRTLDPAREEQQKRSPCWDQTGWEREKNIITNIR